MKQYLKYVWIMCLAVLLHDGVLPAMDSTEDLLSMPVSSVQCSFSQAPTTHELLKDIYNHISSQPIYVKLTDSVQESFSKSSKSLGPGYILRNSLHESVCEDELLSQQFIPANRHKYYIYALRKILI